VTTTAAATSPATPPATPPLSRLRGLVHELAKFGIVGGLAFLVDFGLFNALHFGAGVGPITAKALSTVVSAGSAYVGNRLWAMRHRSANQGGRELSVFVVLNVVGLLITEVFIGFNHYVVGATSVLATNVALVIGTGVATVFRFWAYRRWVFRHPLEVAGDLVERHRAEAEAVLQV